MFQDNVKQIKERLDIVEVVSSYLKLEKTGINMRACCPFHHENKPSFFVSPARQSFRCFGCSKGGDIFTFVQEIEGLEFGDALRILAKKAGVELQQYKANPELQTKKQRLYEILEIACLFFEKQLEQTKVGNFALEYLKQRGLTEAIIKKFRLGFSPLPKENNWRALSDFLVSRGYQREEVVEAGLAITSEKAKTPYDRFRGRIMFPVFDLNSQVVGFGGRVFENPSLPKQEEIAKYINIQNTPLYDKSRILYGLNFAKLAIRQKDFVILTEGYTDVIMSQQHGFENTIAVSGTALTPYHLQIIKRYTNNILTAFDMDKAGGMATKRSIELAQQAGFEVKVITMQQEKDPADIIKENPQEWQKEIDTAKDIMDFYFQDAFTKNDEKTAQGKKNIAETLLKEIKKIPSNILQSHFLKRLANLLKVSEEAVAEEFKKIILSKGEGSFSIKQPTTNESKPIKSMLKSRKQMLEEKALALSIIAPERLEYIDSEDLSFFSEPIAVVFKICKNAFEKKFLKEKEEFNTFLDELSKKNSDFKPLIDDCIFKAELLEEDDPEFEFQTCLYELRNLNKKAILAQLAKEIAIAEREGNEKKLEELSQKFQALTRPPLPIKENS
ncbi:DNA primase [Candidatus Parcubacteria bacterium]|nr:DNA primase [Candidatus Parcubacteria bacterium]